ncbi:MAG: hypothetical protein V9G12_25735 [Microthrixaceae bacterium]
MTTVEHETRPCVLCGEDATGLGEHVVPKWLLKHWLGQGPFTSHVNGEVVLNRVDEPHTDNHLPPVLLPMCSEEDRPGASCNGWLNRKYEQPAKGLIRSTLSGQGQLTGDEVPRFTAWWAKTLLLVFHPLAESTVDGIELDGWDIPDAFYREWRASERIPDDVSVWLAVVNPAMRRGRRSRLGQPECVSLPTTVRADGSGGRCRAGTIGFASGSKGTAYPVAQVAVHPLVDITHPFESRGLAVRIWPESPASLNVGRLARLDAVGANQYGTVFNTIDDEFDINVDMTVNGPSGETTQLDLAAREHVRLAARRLAVPPALSWLLGSATR